MFIRSAPDISLDLSSDKRQLHKYGNIRSGSSKTFWKVLSNFCPRYEQERESGLPKKIPKFHREDEERAFWASHDSAEYLDWGKAEHAIFPRLKPSTKTISLRLPESMLDELRQLANKRDIPYQSLIKAFLRERIDEEYHSVT